MDFLNLAKARFSCRKFLDKPVEEEKIEKILQAGILAPTAVNIQPFKIWVIKSQEAIEKVKTATNFTFKAPVIFAIGASKDGWVRPFDKKEFAEIDASIVTTHMMLEIQDLGLGSTWVGYFDKEKLEAAFSEMKNYSIVALLPTGYPAQEASERHLSRKSMDELVEII